MASLPSAIKGSANPLFELEGIVRKFELDGYLEIWAGKEIHENPILELTVPATQDPDKYDQEDAQLLGLRIAKQK